VSVFKVKGVGEFFPLMTLISIAIGIAEKARKISASICDPDNYRGLREPDL
jgi:hypothetical protein